MSHSSVTVLKVVVLCWAFIPLITGEIEPLPPSQPPQVIAPHCKDRCGNVSIPYPFGIGKGCYFKEHDHRYSSFEVHCDNKSSGSSPIPYFGENVEVLNISVNESELVSKFYASYRCYNQNGDVVAKLYNNLTLTSFTLSSEKNVLVAIGCNTFGEYYGTRNGTNYSAGCLTMCDHKNDAKDGECSGVGCCQTSIPSGVHDITFGASSIKDHTSVYNFNPCSVAFPVAKDSFKFYRENLSMGVADFRHGNKVPKLPVVYSWVVGRKNCSAAKKDGRYLCNKNAECFDKELEWGYRCKCKPGFAGNPYLPDGCTDIDECKGKNDCDNKTENCINTIGSYYCQCRKGFHGNGNGTANGRCISNTTRPWLIPVLATAGAGGVVITLLLIGIFLHWKHGKRQLQKMRESFFQQNGGLLLHEKLSSRRADDTSLKIFTIQDLENASNNFCDENVIGRGGFGIVYKGVLPNNQVVVAIKKSLKVDPNQVEQFINEVLVLSQIKNKYVVKLLGCCLENEVPLLVYEFINNGTLYEHLNDEVKASMLKWPLRLKIASQVANVLSYLHSTISTPIIHRDMKSMNILLDKSYTAKVTDFGASRLVPTDQSKFTTMVLGTRGYLDPEYLQTSELTEKSDVYSFGVVLVELLTRKKAISSDRPEVEKCLAMHFLLKMKEGHLYDILDKNIMSEGTIDEIQQMANLAKWCLMVKGKERPTMKEVALELETIKRKGAHPWNEDGSVHEDCCESLLAGSSKSVDNGGCISGIELTSSYDSQLLSSLESGR